MSPCRIVFFLPMSTCRIIDFCRCHTARSIFLPMLPCQIVKKGSRPQCSPFRRPVRGPVRQPVRGPSGKTAPGMEGPPEKRRTFRENGPWHGRSPEKTQDLPGKCPLAWKVLGPVSCEFRKTAVFRNGKAKEGERMWKGECGRAKMGGLMGFSYGNTPN